MQVYEACKSGTVHDLDIDVSALYLIAAPKTPEPVRKEIIERAHDDRKDFTQAERGRTFKAAVKTVADTKKAAGVLSTKLVDKPKPKPRGHKAVHGAAKKEIAEALGVSTSTVVRAEQHVETAIVFPFMQGDDWLEYHVLEARRAVRQGTVGRAGVGAQVGGGAERGPSWGGTGEPERAGGGP
jgi:hypothetical protein